MKKIRIKFCGFDVNNRFSFAYFVVNILKNYYQVELSEDPEYLFYHESSYEHLKYNCIKIFYTGENISPNFNLCDYAIGFDYLDFGDRYYRLPLYLVTVFYSAKEVELAGDTDFTKKIIFTSKDLSAKTGFCSFVYSNFLADEARKVFFDKLSNYKKVNSGGGYLNNIGGRVENKLEFESKHKFSIAFENTSRAGYTTEKLVASLAARTIPIYWGNPEIGREFNDRRFINCHKYENFDQVVERIKQIDQDDDLYLSIINEPETVNNFKEVRSGFEFFLKHIFEQPINLARRRTANSIRIAELEKHEMIIAKYFQARHKIMGVLVKLYKPLKKIKFFEDLKYKYFKKNKRDTR